MGNYYLAVDLGASGGRLIGGYLKDGRLMLEEIHRFENGMIRRGGSYCWDYNRIFSEILEGMKKCAQKGLSPVSMGIDTWGVDYVLTDRDGKVIGETYGYRDSRTEGMDRKLEEILTPEELYERTGILKASYNTIYQLMADRLQRPQVLAGAHSLLMVPDYLNYLLTGIRRCEYTEASTTQLLRCGEKEWDLELARMLGYPERIFLPVVAPGTRIGAVKEEIAELTGCRPAVTAVASHDTASAIAAIPEEGEFIYISSGTWSLMGTLLDRPICTAQSREANFTNEGGFGDKICFHKNLMGLWMIQSIRKEDGRGLDYGTICSMAEACEDFPSRVDVNHERFLAPESMTEEIRAFCRESGQQVPETMGELAGVVYHSLAESYAQTAEQLEKLTRKTYDRVLIVGGGSSAGYLNRLTEKALKRQVRTGLKEATAAGNILVQMVAEGEVPSYEEGKQMIEL